jgi:predicted ATPase
MKAQINESNVVASRLWKYLLAQAPNTQVSIELSYKHALFIMYLYAMRNTRAFNEAITRQIWARDTPGGSHVKSDESLRTHDVYSWLVNEHPDYYPERLERAYLATLDWLRRQTRLGPRFEPSGRIWLANQARVLRDWLENVNERQLLYAFDQGIAKLVPTDIDVARESFSAELAASCLPENTRNIGDLHGATGHVALEVFESVGAFGSCLLGKEVSIPEAVDMRLKMLGIDISYVNTTIPDEWGTVSWPLNVDMLLVNPTPRGARQRATTDPYVHEDKLAAVNWAQRLCRGTRFRFALVIVPQIDGVSPKWSREVREELIETGRVAAVVDFPREASDTRNSNFSAWLLKGDEALPGNTRQDILFIDARALSLLTPNKQMKASARFIGTMLADIIGGHDASSRALLRLEGENPFLAGIFSREFSPGIFDSPGLSRHVSVKEVKENGYVLTASTYVRPAVEGTWVHGLDRRALDRLLRGANSFGKRMYVIGNNGEGKSMLLRDVAKMSIDNKRLTIAVAAGSSDRFPREVRGENATFYKYRGAKTSARGVNSIQTAVDAAGLMLTIHSDSEKLSVFEDIVSLIGFSAEQFLIPKNVQQYTNVSDSAIGGIARLASQSHDDSLIIDNLRQHPEEQRKYKLGLRRQHNGDGIVPFDELSSGEQQIVVLVAKMVKEAEVGCLFLVDEPEISLHVSWQRALPKLFQIIAQRFNVDILVATHSPVVVASADNEEDHCFTIKNRALITLERMNRRSVETALFEGFRTHTPNNREVHERCASLVADFIDKANQHTINDNPEQDVLQQLEEMKQIISEQGRFDQEENVAFDMRLIERAQAAIQEIVRNASSTTAGDAE